MKKYLTLVLILITIVIGFVGYTVCCEISTIETISPQFPKNFDYIIVDHYDYYWKIVRNKKVDEFLKRSYRVSEHIGEGLDMYVLRFYLNDSQIYSIPYDEIGYPDDAIKIMKELMVENIKQINKK